MWDNMRGTGEYTILFLVNRKLVRRFIMFEQEIESIAAGGSNEEIYYNLLNLTKKAIDRKGRIEGKKKVYYISAEFLIGKLLSNNLINLGLYDTVNEALKKHGKTMADIEEIEPEPSLGNGGLGRLAACFLDSIATLGLPGDGVGLNYHLGLFKQVFEKNMQKETANPWIRAGFAERMSVIRLFLITRRYSLRCMKLT
jgi:starch phosphorylase